MVMIILSELVLKHATQRGTNLGANAVKTNCIYWVMHIYFSFPIPGTLPVDHLLMMGLWPPDGGGPFIKPPEVEIMFVFRL
jgi:hypothetical protein